MQRINQYGLQFLANKIKCTSFKYVKLTDEQHTHTQKRLNERCKN